VATVFSSLASKLVATVFSSLALKLVATVFSSLASKLVPTVSHQFGPQNRWRRFVSGLASKPLKQFRRFGLKIGGDGFWRFGLKTCYDGFWRFGLKTCCDDFWRFGLKTCCDCFFVWPQNRRLRFSDLDIKITMTVSWIGP
jgi:uncharacterized protein YjeT (DUF2065 family)